MRSKDIAQAADDAVIASSRLFVVNWFVGRRPETYITKVVVRSDLWERAEFLTLEDARHAQEWRGADQHGRRGLIYAVSQNSMITVFVDDDYEKRRESCLSG